MELVNEKEYQVVPIEMVDEAPWNYKENDDEQSKVLAANLKRNGQIENVIIREKDDGRFEMVNGNHRLVAMRTLGAKRVFACNKGKITEHEAKRIAIETNETRFQTDQLKLGKIMAELGSTFGFAELAETMPWTQQNLELMAQLESFSWDQYKATEGSEGGSGGVSQEEPFEEMKYYVPKTVATMFRLQLNRISELIAEVTGKPCKDDIRPIEVMSLLIQDISDEALLQHATGE